VTLKEPELLTNIRDFTTLFYVIFRHKSSDWLESSIDSDLSMQFAIYSLDLAFHDFTIFKHCFKCNNSLLKKYLTCLFL